MYLQRSSFGVYYTRIPLAKKARDRGFPHALRISLQTKFRKTASERNAVVCSYVFDFLNNEGSFRSRREFDRDLAALRYGLQRFFRGETGNPPPKLNHSENPSLSASDVKEVSAADSKPRSYRDFAWMIRKYMDYTKGTNVSPKYLKQVEGRLRPLVGFFNDKNPRTLKLTDAMKYQQDLVDNRWSPKTVKEHMRIARQFCNWCVQMDYLNRNPFSGVKAILTEQRAAHEQRDIWTASQLEALFQHESFSNRGSRDDMWIPLILLHTGLRPSEACQLRVEDVCQCDETAIWYFRVTDAGPNQKIKTPNARRDVPVHKTLIDRGFLDYVQRRKRSRKVQLFNCSPTGQDNDWSRNFSHRFNRFLKNKLDYRPGNRPGAYSLRHTFVNALKQADIPEHLAADIVGHSKKSITFDRYGKPSGLKKKARAINAVKFFQS